MRRLAASIAIVFAVVTIAFVLIRIGHGRPFLPSGDQVVDPSVIAMLEEQYGANKPVPVQYAAFLKQLARGNLGESFSHHRPVAQVLAEAIPNTLILTGAALLLDLLLGLALGVYQALRANRLPDVILGNTTLFIYSFPTFWLGLILLLVFGEWLHWFPVGGKTDPVLCPAVDSWRCFGDLLHHLTLPALTLGLVGAAGTARYQRAAMLEVAGQDFIRTARAKGAPERRIVLRHQLRNALLAFITRFGLAFPFLLTGAVLTETIFAWPGMGRIATEAILRRDYPMVTAVALVASVMVVAGNLIADVLLAAADPRVRERTGAGAGAAA